MLANIIAALLLLIVADWNVPNPLYTLQLPLSLTSICDILIIVICRFKCFSQQESAISMLLTLQKKPSCCLRDYTAVPDQQLSEEQMEQDLTLRHLVWEQSAFRNRFRTPMPAYLVVELDVVRKQVCMSSNFRYWQAGNRNHFLLNDLIDWWPPKELLPLTVVQACKGYCCSPE